MRKQIKILLLLAVVIALCAAALVFIITRPAEDDTESAVIGRIKDAVHVTVVTPTGRADFTDTGDKWVYDQDRDFPLNDRYITDIVSAMSDLEPIRAFTAQDTWEAYGLAEGTTTVTVTDADGSELTLELGGMIDEEKYYARVPDSDTVYVISNQLSKAAAVDVADMMTLEKFGSFLPEDVTSVTVTVDGVTTDLTLDDDVRTAASEIRFSSCVSYKADEAELAAAGLDDTAAAVTVMWTEGENTLYVGKSDGNGSYYARLEGSRGLYLIAPAIAETFLN